MRALLIVNPRATSTTRLRRDVIASALASAVKLEVVQTNYRGHATVLAARARSEDYGLVLTLGGDGTVNEVVNGMLGAAGPDDPHVTVPPAQVPLAAEIPALAPIPGGSGNVFAGALGLPRDPVDATGHILRALAEHRERTIGLGVADGRYFTFNCGMGLDAEVVRAVQGIRAHGRQVTPSLYVRLTLRQFYRQTDRRHPAIWIDPAKGDVLGPVFIGIVSNTAPWTYLGGREVNANPRASFDTGLDVFAMARLSSVGAFHAVGQMLSTRRDQIRGRGITSIHDQPAVTLRADRPVAFQIDGEYVGERELARLISVPNALRVFA